METSVLSLSGDATQAAWLPPKKTNRYRQDSQTTSHPQHSLYLLGLPDQVFAQACVPIEIVNAAGGAVARFVRHRVFATETASPCPFRFRDTAWLDRFEFQFIEMRRFLKVAIASQLRYFLF